MAVNLSNITSLINSGVLGLSALFGSHQTASSVAVGPIAKLEAYVAEAASMPGSLTTNAESIKAQASLIASLFASSNPAAAGTAAEIMGNPSALPTLLPMLSQEINQQSGNILSSLAQAVHLSGGSLTLN